jgi:hypothetical protein
LKPTRPTMVAGHPAFDQAASAVRVGQDNGASQTPPVALATFIPLLRLGMAPLPGGSGATFATRLANVLLASAYAVGAISVPERWRTQPIPVTPARAGAR